LNLPLTINALTEKYVIGIEANELCCRELVEKGLAMVTALAPLIGYDAAAAVAHEAVATGKTVREVARLKNALTPEQLEKALDPWSMTMPGREKEQ
jgi:fumarate hydratase, class II